MNKHPYIEAPTLTKNEFKAQVIASINSAEFTPELLRKMLPIMPDDKRTLFEKYRATDIVDPISNDKDEWERGAYFHKQLKMAEQNFCLERIEHLIAVKSYLIERGIAGFSSPKKTAPNTLSTSQKDKTMSTTFLSIDSTDFKPSSSLRNCVDGDDMSSIRNSLFMEMNDKRMTNETLLQAIAWTLKKHSNLFVTYEENAYAQAMEMDDGKWDRQYYSLQEVYTSMNFSEERVLHMLEVRNHVFNIQPNMTSIQPKTAVSVGTSVPQTTQKTPPPHTRINKAPDNKNEINTLLLIGGALAALALVFSSRNYLVSHTMNSPLNTYGQALLQTELLPAQQDALNTISTAHALINKSYLAELKDFDVLPVNNQYIVPLNRGGDVRIFRVERLVQENKQSVLESTTAAYTALGAAGYTVFLFLKSDGKETLLYIGTRGEPAKMLGKNSGDLLQETFKGHFPGSKLCSLNGTEVDALLDGVSEESNSKTVTAVSSVPALSTTDQEHFMQGLERFIDAAESRVYEGLILAEPVSMQALNTVRSGFEQVATQLSALSKRQYNFGIQDSEAISLSISQSLSQSLGESLGLTETNGTSESTSTSTSDTHTTNTSKSSPNKIDKFVGTGAMAIGSLAGPIGVLIGGQVASLFQTTDTAGTSDSHSTTKSSSYSTNNSTATSTTTTKTDTQSATDTQGLSQTYGTTRQISYETTDKGILGMLDKIDHHLKRINEAKSHGGWHSTAYFVSDSAASCEALASIFLGLTRGTQSSTEDFALTTWAGKKANAVAQWLGQLMHPRLAPAFAVNTRIPYLTPATLVSSKEMAIQLSLPRRSTSCVVVQEAATFGRKVQFLNNDVQNNTALRTISLGYVHHLWTDLPQTVQLDLDQLTGHTLITGSTGSGKSNTIYALLKKGIQEGIPFLVIEPAKGEYKHVFGNRESIRVLGTNSKFTELLKINPFSFPEQTHVLEHVDRLIEVFNVCWPMYAAMPAILKDAVLRSYEACSWDMRDSTSGITPALFPTFADLLIQLEYVITQSAYSDEMKSNYIGALVTRVRSMVNGLNGQIFTADEISNTELFDSNVIVDLSRVGSQETKSLLIGLLVIKLGEYRAEKITMNQPLRHITVLEEAHHILRANPINVGAESGNLTEKSIEMLSNAIAEMRTYGEGFIIADQSPSTIHISAIRNTNTKILMRLPDEADRMLAGKSAALTNEQIDELARLPRGIAVVYQNEWLEAVLCKVHHVSCKPHSYIYTPRKASQWDELAYRAKFVLWLLAPRCQQDPQAYYQLLSDHLIKSNLPTQTKLTLASYLNTSHGNQRLLIHDDSQFSTLSKLVVTLLDCEHRLHALVSEVVDIPQLQVAINSLIAELLGHQKIPMAMTITQCLLKSISSKGNDYTNLYFAWTNFITKEYPL